MRASSQLYCSVASQCVLAQPEESNTQSMDTGSAQLINSIVTKGAFPSSPQIFFKLCSLAGVNTNLITTFLPQQLLGCCTLLPLFRRLIWNCLSISVTWMKKVHFLLYVASMSFAMIIVLNCTTMLVLTPDNDPSPWYCIGYVKAHCDNLNGELQETDRTMLDSWLCSTAQYAAQTNKKYQNMRGSKMALERRRSCW